MLGNQAGNPYTLEPIRDPALFFGREALLDACCSSLVRRTRALSVVGLPGSGKTSLLYQIANKAAGLSGNGSGQIFLPIYIDCHKMPDPPAFARYVADEILRLCPDCQTAEFDLPVADESDLQNLLADLPHKAVFLLDDICSMARNPSFTVTFFSFLRGIAIDIDIDVPMITTSSQRLVECVPKSIVASEFPNIFSTVPLPPLSAEEMEAALQAHAARSGIDLAPYSDEIVALSGRIPILAQMACALYHDALAQSPGRLTEGQRASIREQLGENARPYFLRTWKLLPEAVKAWCRQPDQSRDPTPSSTESAHFRYVGLLQEGGIFCQPFAEFAAQMASA